MSVNENCGAMALIWAIVVWLLRHTPEASVARMELCRAYNISLDAPAQGQAQTQAQTQSQAESQTEDCWSRGTRIAYFDWMYRSFVDYVFFAACLAYMFGTGMSDAIYFSVAACDLLAFLFRVLITRQCSIHAKCVTIMNETGAITLEDIDDEFWTMISIHKYYIIVCVVVLVWHSYALVMSEKTIEAVVAMLLHGVMLGFAVMEARVVMRVSAAVRSTLLGEGEYAHI